MLPRYKNLTYYKLYNMHLHKKSAPQASLHTHNFPLALTHKQQEENGQRLLFCVDEKVTHKILILDNSVTDK